MNVLDKISSILGLPDIALGYLPNQPDTIVALFEYDTGTPEHTFGKTDFLIGVQVRSRALSADTAYNAAESAAGALNRYSDADVAIIQLTPVLDIGRDNANPPRQEYTVNFTVRRK